MWHKRRREDNQSCNSLPTKQQQKSNNNNSNGLPTNNNKNSNSLTPPPTKIATVLKAIVSQKKATAWQNGKTFSQKRMEQSRKKINPTKVSCQMLYKSAAHTSFYLSCVNRNTINVSWCVVYAWVMAYKLSKHRTTASPCLFFRARWKICVLLALVLSLETLFCTSILLFTINKILYCNSEKIP